MIRSAALDATSWAAPGVPVFASSAPPPNSSTQRLTEAANLLPQKSITSIFVGVVVLGLVIFIVTYCMAYIIWFIILKRGQRNHLLVYEARAATTNIEDEEGNSNNNAAGAAAGLAGTSTTLVSSLPIVQYNSSAQEIMISRRMKESLQYADEEEHTSVIRLWVKECAVCLSEYEEGEEMKVLPGCGHCFHKACIDMWLFSHTTCPLCRLSLLKHNVQVRHGNSR